MGLECKYPSAEEIARRLGTTKKKFHSTIKPQIKRDFAAELRKINATNPDIGINELGNIALRHPQTGKEIITNVSLLDYAE